MSGLWTSLKQLLCAPVIVDEFHLQTIISRVDPVGREVGRVNLWTGQQTKLIIKIEIYYTRKKIILKEAYIAVSPL